MVHHPLAWTNLPTDPIQAAHDNLEGLGFREKVKLDTQGISLRSED
jgi:hypothetical protein